MKRKADYPLQKVTLNLREGDWEWLRQMHGNMGAARVIRELVIGHRKRVEETLAQRDEAQLPLPMTEVLSDLKAT